MEASSGSESALGMRSGNGIRLGTVAGIPIVLDFSFFISLVLITVLLGTRVFPNMVEPEPSDATAWGLAAVAAVIFFTSLLLHELAHSVVARMYGMHVANITLFLLGGVSQITQDSKRPSQEFLIAFVGPLTSAILGGAFIGLYVAVGGGDTPLAALLAWLAIVNIALALFNMIPGFPLDGGRVFRALLWALTGSRSRATRWSSRVGQGVGGLLAIYGLISFLNIDIGLETGGVGGIWLVFVGGFLYNAASQSLRSAQAEDRLAGVVVRDVMSTQLRAVDAETLVRRLLPRRDEIDPRSAFMVTRAGTVVGVTTGSALLLLDEERYRTARMEDVMISADAITPIAPGASGREALNRLQTEGSPVLPVVENGRLLGFVGLDQVAQALRKPTAARAAG